MSAGERGVAGGPHEVPVGDAPGAAEVLDGAEVVWYTADVRQPAARSVIPLEFDVDAFEPAG